MSYALRLEFLTIGWNVLEGVIAIGAALRVGSVALLGFGMDSFVETASGAILTWRLFAERSNQYTDRSISELDEKAKRLVAVTLFLLGAYIALDAGMTLWKREAPEPTLIGIALTSISFAVMWWLARAKKRAAVALQSRALAADSVQTTACWWLSLVVLGGIGLNALFGWWWADPLAALGMTVFLMREGREAWRGDDCCG